MRIGDRKTNSMMKETAGPRQERFAQDNRSNRGSTNRSMTVIKGFGFAANRSGKKTLMVPRRFAIGVQPASKACYYSSDLVGQLVILFGSRMDIASRNWRAARPITPLLV